MQKRYSVVYCVVLYQSCGLYYLKKAVDALFFLGNMDGHGIFCNDRTIQNLQEYAKLVCSFLHSYSSLIEAYVLDYFVSNHWGQLPLLWQETAADLEPQDLGRFLNKEEPLISKQVYPLSLLAFRASAFALSFPRSAVGSPQPIKQFLKELFPVKTQPTDISCCWEPPEAEFLNKSGQHKNLVAALRRHVKKKKQHEIFRLSQAADVVFRSLDVNHVFDIGSGQGHLSRLLCFHHGFKVVTVEAEHAHVSGAEKFDKQAFLDLQKKNGVSRRVALEQPPDNFPKHVESFISVKASTGLLQDISKQAWPLETEPSFGLLGLHTCGNLAATLLELFTETKNAQALLSVGCCYMKLDTESEMNGYPLSKYMSLLPHSSLSYEAREIACHALEMYIKRLYENASSLKIHCYRAALEKLIVKYHPSMKHTGLGGVKNYEKMSFSEYAVKALKGKGMDIPEEEFSSAEVDCFLEDWKKVTVVYSLRLLVAPVLESLILLDRMFYLYENGCQSCLIPIFDPTVSPRNHVLIAVKKKETKGT